MWKLDLRHKAFVVNQQGNKILNRNLGLEPEVQLNQSVVASTGHSKSLRKDQSGNFSSENRTQQVSYQKHFQTFKAALSLFSDSV